MNAKVNSICPPESRSRAHNHRTKFCVIDTCRIAHTFCKACSVHNFGLLSIFFPCFLHCIDIYYSCWRCCYFLFILLWRLLLVCIQAIQFDRSWCHFDCLLVSFYSLLLFMMRRFEGTAHNVFPLFFDFLDG